MDSADSVPEPGIMKISEQQLLSIKQATLKGVACFI